MARHFPRPRRVLAALAVGSMLASVAALPLASADNLKHRRHQVQRKLHGAQSDLDESSARLRHATAALQSAQARLRRAQGHLALTRGQLSAAQVLDRQMQAKLEAAVSELQQAQADLASSRAQIAEQRRALSEIVVQSYQTGDPTLLGLSMVLTSQDPTELTGQLNSVQNVVDKQGVILDRLEATKVLRTVQEHRVAAAKAQVARERQAAAENLRRRQRLEQQAQAAEQRVHTLVGLRAQARRAAARARAGDLRQLRALQRERDRISAILKRRAEAARRRAARGNGGWGAANGLLAWPVAGPVTSRFGWRVHPIFGYRSLHDGIDIAAACGTPIHAPASGRVIEEYYQTAWGNRIIIDHGWRNGAGVATIANHLSRYAVRRGAWVRRGEVVGYVGTTGWSTGCHTHFTVLRNGVAVNPMNYL